MTFAISETNRRRAIQEAYNREHNIEPRGIVKSIRDLTDRVKVMAEILTELLLERAQRKLIKYQIQTRQFEAKYGGSFLDFRQTALTSPLAADVEQDYFDWELAFTGVEDMTREVAQLKQTALQQ
jgi:excinuclease UvrABC helicase subunit UvrB